METIDLRGYWNYETDELCRGIEEKFYERKLKRQGFSLPGSACEHCLGKRAEAYTEMNRDTVRAPRERYEYIGMLWLQRNIEVPDSFAGKRVTLFLERVNIASTIWVDGNPVGEQFIGLSTPHSYDVSDAMTPGKHCLTICVDNRDLIHMDDMASGYSIDTQGIWNGIIGRIELRSEEIIHIQQVQIEAEPEQIKCKVISESGNVAIMKPKEAKMSFTVISREKEELENFEKIICQHASKQTDYFMFSLKNRLEYWSEFHPNLYRMQIKLFYKNEENQWIESDKKDYTFGVREIAVKEKQFCLNGKPMALRGTTDCAIFPMTGYPAMVKGFWTERFSKIKAFGMNHVRFHAWCPPEAAFAAADEAGVYLSVEMPLWLNGDVTKHRVGDVPMHRSYYMQEAKRISDTYGNHPSFLMFSNGNELAGDFALLEEITSYISAYDKRRLYTMTSNFDHPVAACEDYFCAFLANGRPIRLENLQDEAAEGTFLDYKEAVEDMTVPVVSFEVGQYCVYPELDKINQYRGNMRPVNLEVIREHMMQSGSYHKLSEYVNASGRLALKLYKEDIEAALRTKGMGGIQLLSLSDYTGQCTATIGMLDAFYRKKDFVSEEEFQQFSNCVVPLFKAKRIFSNQEKLEAELDLYDYGDTAIHNPVFEVRIYERNELKYEINTTERRLSIPLDFVEEAALLKVEVSVENYKNAWNIFVYPKENMAAEKENIVETAAKKAVWNFDDDIFGITLETTASGRKELKFLKDCSEILHCIKEGGKLLLMPQAIKKPVEGNFIPVFWSPAFFPSTKSCGAIIQDKHPVFADFPTEETVDYQWKKLLEHGVAMDISVFGAEFEPIFEPVPNFFDNKRKAMLFEARVGKAEVLFCGFDLSQKDLPACQLKKSILSYFASEKFAPEQEIEAAVILEQLNSCIS